MFNYDDVIAAFKAWAISLAENYPSHCQLLEESAKLLGFQSYHHLRTTLKNQHSEHNCSTSLAVMRQICSLRSPSQNCAYYKFRVQPSGEIGFYSQWAGRNSSGVDIMVPRPFDGKEGCSLFRKALPGPIYVLESCIEVDAWHLHWHSDALIPEFEARAYFPLIFLVANQSE